MDTSKVSLREGDRIYNEVLEWVSVNVIGRDSVLSDGSRSLTAFSGKAWDPSKSFDSTSPSIQYNSSTKSRTYFLHGWTLIMFRIEKEVISEEAVNKKMVLTCLGFKTAPLRLLDHCRMGAIKKKSNMTTFHKTYGASQKWDQGITQPSRPLATVDMDQEQKRSLVDDIRKYLRPAGRRFYAHRGIPYRRGYLFYGPPGMGKTSMCLALAGAFNLELFVLDLHRFRHGDTGLMKLFNELPPKCIVLLEDIDSARVQRENAYSPDPRYVKDEAIPVTLSGLLNAFDGVASPEGRVLIMTSNDPEALDRALIRPGSIDMQVFFGPVSRKIAGRMFILMYKKILHDFETAAERKEAISLETLKFDNDVSDMDSPRTTLNKFSAHHGDIRDMAKRFASKVPEDKFSPAEIQGYLLTKQEDPEAAVEDADTWVAKMLESKKEGMNVIAVDVKGKHKAAKDGTAAKITAFPAGLGISASSVISVTSVTTLPTTPPELDNQTEPGISGSSREKHKPAKDATVSSTANRTKIPIPGSLKAKPKVSMKAKATKTATPSQPTIAGPSVATPPAMPPITDELESDDEFREIILELNTSSPPILVDFRPKGSPKSDTEREKQKRLSQQAYYKSNEGI